MPANYAHYRFGKLALPKLPAEARQCIGRFRRLYDIGLHGPDIFFYYNPAIDTAVGQLGHSYHTHSGQLFFSAACTKADSEAAKAYLLGVLGHRGGTAHRHRVPAGAAAASAGWGQVSGNL